MAELPGIQQRAAAIAKEVAEGNCFELVHCQIAGSRRSPVVRVFIDKPEGVTVEDCAVVSREMEAILDREDLIPTSYVLEVSSPGIERELFTIDDFKRFAGHSARVKTVRPVNGQRNFTGTIVGTGEAHVEFDDRTSGRVEIPFDAVVKANLMVDLQSEFKKA
ncbi:MAG TPA: ribosome maturation factor RimP [Pyrinomonadaceae bacterium]|jgi:ribosome maturation factor RimP